MCVQGNISKKGKIMMKNIFFNKKRKEIIFLFSLLPPLTLGGCNTMEGLGTDIKHGGEALERSAENNKECCKRCPQCGHCH